jgi:phosphoserine phosphatase
VESRGKCLPFPGLTEMIKIIFFDMDGVLTEEKSSWFYVNNRLGINNRENFIKYMDGKLPYEDFFIRDIRAWIEKYPGIRHDDIKKILDEIDPVPGLENAISYLKRNGIMSVIVSGGILWLAERLVKDYGIDEAYANGIFSDSTGKIIPDGEVQVNPLKKDIVMKKVMEKYNVSPEECIAVGDSESDYSMYRAVNNFIAFNSDSEALSKISKITLGGNIMSVINYIKSN